MVDTILIIEDEKLLGSELERHYSQQGYEVIWAQTYADAAKILRSKKVDPSVILSDLNLPDGNGLDLMEKNKFRVPGCEWVFLTGYGDVPDSVHALRIGAFDFLTKPCPLEQLDMTIHSALRSAKAQSQLLSDTQGASQRYTPEAMLGDSHVAEQTRQMLQQLSQVPFSAMILTGETGTGKGLATRILHYNSPRAQKPLVELNCAALPKDLLESELFGHEAGAFTGSKGRHRGLVEQASGGTLFLDEIGEMPLDLQSKLLKILEDHKFRRLGGEREITVDIQVIAATNKNLQNEIRDGNFRMDLYHRLSVFELELPTLRERIEDLHQLVPHFVNEYNLKSNKNVTEVSAHAWEMMQHYTWPGNIRELRNVLERCVMLSTSEQLPEQWLQLQAKSTANDKPVFDSQQAQPDTCAFDENPSTVTDATTSTHIAQPGAYPGTQLCLPTDGSMSYDEMEAEIIQKMLEECDDNVTEVARKLKTTREKVRYRIDKYKLR